MTALIFIGIDMLVYPLPGSIELTLLGHLVVPDNSPVHWLASILSDSIYLLGATCIFYMAYTFWRHSYLAAAYLGLGVLLLTTIEPLKDLFHRNRPEVQSLFHSTFLGFGFPSGHSLAVILLTGMLVYIYIHSHNVGLQARRIIYIFAAIYILLVGWSRLALAAHFPSDVVGGYVIGLGYLLLINQLFSWFQEFQLNRIPNPTKPLAE